jgi:hypothetical protein
MMFYPSSQIYHLPSTIYHLPSTIYHLPLAVTTLYKLAISIKLIEFQPLLAIIYWAFRTEYEKVYIEFPRYYPCLTEIKLAINIDLSFNFG